MNKKTPAELRDQLIHVLQFEIIPTLKYYRNDACFPFYFAKLSKADIVKLVTEMDCTTDRFGKIRNEMLQPFTTPKKDWPLVNKMNHVFWWPAVDRIWPLQCFEVKTPTEHVNDIYILARTGPDEWIGLQSKVCYLTE